MTTLYRRILVIIVIFICTCLSIYFYRYLSLPENIVSLTSEIDNRNNFISLLKDRRSTRQFSDSSIPLKGVAEVLYAAQGITRDNFFRTAPSAGGLYPLKVYLIAIKVDSLKPGLYVYSPQYNGLILKSDFSKLSQIAESAYRQNWIKDAPAIIILTGDVNITAKKYGQRANDYLMMEIGSVAQNIYLQATYNQLATTLVGGIDREKIKDQLSLDYIPYAVMPIGYRRSSHL